MIEMGKSLDKKSQKWGKGSKIWKIWQKSWKTLRQTNRNKMAKNKTAQNSLTEYPFVTKCL